MGTTYCIQSAIEGYDTNIKAKKSEGAACGEGREGGDVVVRSASRSRSFRFPSAWKRVMVARDLRRGRLGEKG
jgi:hypothetical protein